MVKKSKIFKLDELYIPDNKIRMIFENKKEFIGWCDGCYIFVIKPDPDEDGNYSFYAFDSEGNVSIYKQTEAKL